MPFTNKTRKVTKNSIVVTRGELKRLLEEKFNCQIPQSLMGDVSYWNSDRNGIPAPGDTVISLEWELTEEPEQSS